MILIWTSTMNSTQFYLEEPIRLPSPHRINFSVRPFVRLLSMKTRRIFTKELKSGCPRGVFWPLSISSKYLFLCTRRNFWVQQENLYKITYCLRVLPTKFLHYVPYTRGALMGWRNFSKIVEKKFLQPMHNGCFWKYDQSCISTWDIIYKYRRTLIPLLNTRCAWAGGTFLRCLRKVPWAHSRSACVLQELGWKYT
jgi:hypothetical protein